MTPTSITVVVSTGELISLAVEPQPGGGYLARHDDVVVHISVTHTGPRAATPSHCRWATIE